MSAKRSFGPGHTAGLLAVFLLAALGAWKPLAAGEASKSQTIDPNKDHFVLFSGDTATKAPGMTGDSGVSTDVKPDLATVGNRIA